MECDFGIKVKEPTSIENIFTPFIQFKLALLNDNAECYNEDEIDFQIDLLLDEIKKMRNKAKKELKAAKARHDIMLSGK